jgi:hypothetical protein
MASDSFRTALARQVLAVWSTTSVLASVLGDAHTTTAHGRLMLTVLGGLAKRTRPPPLPGTAPAACIGFA